MVNNNNSFDEISDCIELVQNSSEKCFLKASSKQTQLPQQGAKSCFDLEISVTNYKEQILF